MEDTMYIHSKRYKSAKTACSQCGDAIERDKRFVGKLKLKCEKCKTARRAAYDKKRNAKISKFLRGLKKGGKKS